MPYWFAYLLLYWVIYGTYRSLFNVVANQDIKKSNLPYFLIIKHNIFPDNTMADKMFAI